MFLSLSRSPPVPSQWSLSSAVPSSAPAGVVITNSSLFNWVVLCRKKVVPQTQRWRNEECGVESSHRNKTRFFSSNNQRTELLVNKNIIGNLCCQIRFIHLSRKRRADVAYSRGIHLQCHPAVSSIYMRNFQHTFLFHVFQVFSYSIWVDNIPNFVGWGGWLNTQHNTTCLMGIFFFTLFKLSILHHFRNFFQIFFSQ